MPATDNPRQPTADERAGMEWWNSLTEPERIDALNRAGDGGHIPSVADAWAFHKGRLSRSTPMPETTVRIDVELPPAEALALAQFLKRATWSAMRECAVDDAECYLIRDGIDKVRTALADAGYAPR
jgi:hypothetical protein